MLIGNIAINFIKIPNCLTLFFGVYSWILRRDTKTSEIQKSYTPIKLGLWYEPVLCLNIIIGLLYLGRRDRFIGVLLLYRLIRAPLSGLLKVIIFLLWIYLINGYEFLHSWELLNIRPLKICYPLDLRRYCFGAIQLLLSHR